MKNKQAAIIFAYVLLAAVWVITPFTSWEPAWVEPAFVGFNLVAVVIGIFVAFKCRNVLLGIMSVFTIFAWPILLVISFSSW